VKLGVRSPQPWVNDQQVRAGNQVLEKESGSGIQTVLERGEQIVQVRWYSGLIPRNLVGQKYQAIQRARVGFQCCVAFDGAEHTLITNPEQFSSEDFAVPLVQNHWYLLLFWENRQFKCSRQRDPFIVRHDHGDVMQDAREFGSVRIQSETLGQVASLERHGFDVNRNGRKPVVLEKRGRVAQRVTRELKALDPLEQVGIQALKMGIRVFVRHELSLAQTQNARDAKSRRPRSILGILIHACFGPELRKLIP
jgi:hypothetical protein